ncbi:hypothetical protein ACIP93_17290 [Streptomyces sp. NPDC088745]|uniref:hypothetical protein n=1 Tax=Streptomyces sp. NPDC088745 TaxID=3365884 RepID=UPI00380A9E1C
MRVIQLPLSLAEFTLLDQTLAGRGPVAEAAALEWEVYASTPLHGGTLTDPRLSTLVQLLHQDLSIPQACLLAIAS